MASIDATQILVNGVLTGVAQCVAIFDSLPFLVRAGIVGLVVWRFFKPPPRPKKKHCYCLE